MARWIVRAGIVAIAVGCGGRTIETEAEGGGSGGTRAAPPAGGSSAISAGGSAISAGGSAVVATGGTVSIGTGGAGFGTAGTGFAAAGTAAAGAGPEVEPPPDCASGEPVMIPPEVVVERLSRVFLGVPPSDELFRRGFERDLSTSAAVGCFAREILLDHSLPDYGIGQFFLGLLNEERDSESLVDPTYVPEFNRSLLARANEGAILFAKTVIRRWTGSLSELLQSPGLFVDRELGSALGLVVDSDDLTLVQDGRGGLFTQPYFLMARSTAAHGSPTQRGLTLMQALACQEFPRPPERVSSVPAVFESTTRAWYEAAIFDSGFTCTACHSLFTAAGFTFEHFDVLGRYRDHEAGQAIDASGQLYLDSEVIEVENHHAAMSVLVTHPVVHDCLARQWLGHALGIARTGASGNAGSLDPSFPQSEIDRLVRRARYSDTFNLRELFVAGVETPEFLE